jgi:hypothetical protein
VPHLLLGHSHPRPLSFFSKIKAEQKWQIELMMRLEDLWHTLTVLLAIVWLTKLFNLIFRSNKMSDEWRRSILVPIFKNKGDVQSCTNYRGIKLMSHTMKLWERIIEHHLRGVTNITENQFGFMPGRPTMEAIFLIRQLM